MSENSKSSSAPAGELVPTTAIVPTSFAEAKEMAHTFSKASIITQALKGKEADVLVTIATGLELGLSPMASLRGLDVVEGQIYMRADLMVALCMRSRVCEYFRPVVVTDTKVTYETKRAGEKPETMTWSIEDAKRAGLAGKSVWQKYPRLMLSNRCKSELAKLVYPDVLFGIGETEELEEVHGEAKATWRDTSEFQPPPGGAPVIDVEPVEEPPPADEPKKAARKPRKAAAAPAPASDQEPNAEEGGGDEPTMVDRIKACMSLDELDELARAVIKLPKPEQEKCRGPYRQRKAELSEPGAV